MNWWIESYILYEFKLYIYINIGYQLRMDDLGGADVFKPIDSVERVH
jgi:hypothetical protein